MAYTDFIAAIDLGSSHMVGMVGAKGPAGTLSIIAYEVENSDTCIRRGCVYNIKDGKYSLNTERCFSMPCTYKAIDENTSHAKYHQCDKKHRHIWL